MKRITHTRFIEFWGGELVAVVFLWYFCLDQTEVAIEPKAQGLKVGIFVVSWFSW